MGRATGDPRIQRFHYPTSECTDRVRATLSPIKALAQCSSKGMSTGGHVRTRFLWNVLTTDATPEEVAQARAALAALPGVGSIQVGPWGGELVHKVEAR